MKFGVLIPRNVNNPLIEDILVSAASRRRSKLLDGEIIDALIAACHWWKEKRLPKHFEKSAALEYNYNPRSKKYQAVKRRINSGNFDPRPRGSIRPPIYDLTWTGKLKVQATGPLLRQPKAEVKGRAGKYRVSMVLKVPEHIRYAKQPVGQELVRLSFREMQAIEKTVYAYLLKRMLEQ